MLTIYVLAGILYLVIMLVLSACWDRSGEAEHKPIPGKKVSVLVPFRNEQDNIADSFDQLSKLDYPDLEIIWINDHSEDASPQILGQLLHAPEVANKSMCMLYNEGEGKKAAITTGVKSAVGEIIVTTDADCRVSDFWIVRMISPFAEKDIQLVAGPVMTFPGKTFFQKFQQIEWASILLVTHAAFFWERPLMCSGANMAYRKASFLEVDGYVGNLQYWSGDDEFLLKKIIAKYGRKAAVYKKETEVLVYTKAAESWDELIRQRVRWASKWKSHDSFHRFFSLVPVLFQLIFISSLLGVFFDPDTGKYLWVIWVFKLLGESIALGRIMKFFHLKIRLTSILLTGLVHPGYVILTAVGALRGKFNWKGRE